MNRTICCMTDSTLGSLNSKVILNQFVSVSLELLQDLPEQCAPANQWLDHKWNGEWQKKFIPAALNPSEKTVALHQLESSLKR